MNDLIAEAGASSPPSSDPGNPETGKSFYFFSQPVQESHSLDVSMDSLVSGSGKENKVFQIRIHGFIQVLFALLQRRNERLVHGDIEMLRRFAMFRKVVFGVFPESVELAFNTDDLV